VEVPVAAAKLEVWPQTVRVQGSLLADEQAVIGSKLAGRVEKADVELGTVVRAGQTLVTLERRELELRVQLAQAQLRQACAAVGLMPDDSEAQLNPENSPPVLVERAAMDEAQAAFTRAERLRARQVVTEAEFEQIQAQLKSAQARYRSAVNDVHEQIAVIGQRRADLALA
jgi:multidrug efflux pump subunit AcrA (membrane-fusion protein)